MHYYDRLFFPSSPFLLIMLSISLFDRFLILIAPIFSISSFVIFFSPLFLANLFDISQMLPAIRAVIRITRSVIQHLQIEPSSPQIQNKYPMANNKNALLFKNAFWNSSVNASVSLDTSPVFSSTKTSPIFENLLITSGRLVDRDPNNNIIAPAN